MHSCIIPDSASACGCKPDVEGWPVEQEMQVGHSQALRDAQQQAEEQLAEAHKQAVQQRDEHQAALRELEQAHEARVAEAGKQLQQLKDEHQRMVWPSQSIWMSTGLSCS